MSKLVDAVSLFGPLDAEVTAVSLKGMYNLCLGAEACVFTGPPALDADVPPQWSTPAPPPASLLAAHAAVTACASASLAEMQRVRRDVRRSGADDGDDGYDTAAALEELHDVCKTVMSALEAQAKLPPIDSAGDEDEEEEEEE
jgi:hypothetical protein